MVLPSPRTPAIVASCFTLGFYCCVIHRSHVAIFDTIHLSFQNGTCAIPACEAYKVSVMQFLFSIQDAICSCTLIHMVSEIPSPPSACLPLSAVGGGHESEQYSKGFHSRPSKVVRASKNFRRGVWLCSFHCVILLTDNICFLFLFMYNCCFLAFLLCVVWPRFQRLVALTFFQTHMQPMRDFFPPCDENMCN